MTGAALDEPWSLKRGDTILMRSAIRIAVALLALACSKAPENRASEAEPSPQSASATPATTQSAAPAIVERDWALVTLGGSAAPLGSGGKPATIRLDSASARAAGFAGCNRYSAQYTMVGDSLHFGPAISTKMACAEGDSLERAYLSIIPDVTSYQATDSTMTLAGASGPLAGFRVQ